MTPRPNLLMLVLDQLRHDSLGVTSDGAVSTPHLDALAARGVRFNRAFCAIPTCCPSRQSMLTGLRPEQMGTLWNYDIGSRVPALDPSWPTWTQGLTDRGYRTVYLGKWHVSPDHGPTDFGYERFEDLRVDDGPSAGDAGVNVGVPWRGELDDRPLDDTDTHWLAGRAVSAIRELAARRGPWHLRVDWVEPHLPCRPHPSFYRRYRDQAIDLWPSHADALVDKPFIQRQQRLSWGVDGWQPTDWVRWKRHYYAVISQVDDAIGHMLHALEETGQAQETIVVATADHGDMAGSHGMLDKHYVQYDDVTRVPLLVAGPGVVPAIRDEFVYNGLDLAPTLAELTGMAGLTGPGRSLVPLLHAAGVDDWRRAAVTTFNGQQAGLFTQRAIRTARWKYVWNATDVDELYDLDRDPWELSNVATVPQHSEVMAELRRELLDTLKREGDPQVDNPWVEAQLAGTGGVVAS